MRKLVLVFAALMLAALGASAGPPPRYFVNESKLPFLETGGIPTQRFWGVHNGAGYRIEVPDSWNGSLVMWAHGFRGEGLELTVDNHPLREFLIARDEPTSPARRWAATSPASWPSSGRTPTTARCRSAVCWATTSCSTISSISISPRKRSPG